MAFHGEIHGGADGEEQGAFIADWFRSVASGRHPSFTIADSTVVEQIETGEIVSSLSLIPERWTYGGIPFDVGRIEFVSTRPDVRRRGLVRRQLDIVHRRSAEQGHLAQAIGGLPTFYRRFGYELALELAGGRIASRPAVLELPAGETEAVRLRPATQDDVAFMMALDEAASSRWLVTGLRDQQVRHFEMCVPRDERFRSSPHIIERADGEPVGYLAHAGELWGSMLSVHAYELVDGISWLWVTPAVLRALRTTGDAFADGTPASPLTAIRFDLGTDHPVYRAMPDRLGRTIRPYAWYLRVPDLPGLLRQIAPVLEQRLALSVAVGHSGDLRVGSYDGGVRLVLADGRLATAESWDGGPDDGGAWFPGLSFLHLVFGHRSLSELEGAQADCRVTTEEARVLLDALFPTRPSRVWNPQ